VSPYLRSDLIDAIFSQHGISGTWEQLPSTGIANWIYATHDVVLRVATDHRDGIPDARTESVAAPAAYAAGILTPRMIAFDDTRTLVDRPFSLWERVHGATLGQIALSDDALLTIWRSVGRELARLHRLVTACSDPQGYLDTPGDEPDTDRQIAMLVATGRLDATAAGDIAAACSELGQIASAPEVAFTHGDVHRMNVMCDDGGRLLALIDWGDAGWSDPMHDFSSMPLEAIPSAIAGYEAETGEPLDNASRGRLIRVKVISALDHFVRHPDRPMDGDAIRRFVRSDLSK
jgi:aminoglycoside phosphotransferase (APT) family kinase protein